MKIDSIFVIIRKLKTAGQALSIDKQESLGKWLEEYIRLHDNKLIDETMVNVLPDKQNKKVNKKSSKTYIDDYIL